MKCPACERAEHRPLTGIFQAGCQGCDARALAGSPEAHQALKSQAMTPEYRAALERLAPGAAAELHKSVKAWHERMKA